MRIPRPFYTLVFVTGLTLGGAACNSEDQCSPPAAMELGKLGSSGECGCLGNGDCPTNQTCEGNILDPLGVCECQAGSNGAECDSSGGCAAGQTCSFNCTCEGTATPTQPTATPNGCPAVNVPAGSVPNGGACDEDADCSVEMPCVDCHCV